MRRLADLQQSHVKVAWILKSAKCRCCASFHVLFTNSVAQASRHKQSRKFMAGKAKNWIGHLVVGVQERSWCHRPHIFTRPSACSAFTDEEAMRRARTIFLLLAARNTLTADAWVMLLAGIVWTSNRRRIGGSVRGKGNLVHVGSASGISCCYRKP